MRKVRDLTPYMISLLIGMFMPVGTISGYHRYYSGDTLLGWILITISMIIWPLYAGIILLLGINKALFISLKPFRKSIYLTPVGALLTVIIIRIVQG